MRIKHFVSGVIAGILCVICVVGCGQHVPPTEEAKSSLTQQESTWETTTYETETAETTSVRTSESGAEESSTIAEETITPPVTTEPETQAPAPVVCTVSEHVISCNSVTRQNAGSGVCDLLSFPDKVSGSEVRGYIEQYAIPQKPYYNGRARTADDDARLLASRNLDAIPETVEVQYAVFTQNSAVRAFPTLDVISEDGVTSEFDYLQETMYTACEGALILHQSADGAWCFIQGYQYRGWVQTASLAFCSREAMASYTEAQGYAVVIAANTWIGDVCARMGTKLPITAGDDASITVLMPRRDANGNLYPEAVTVANNGSFSIGYLPLGAEAIVNQAMKLQGMPYGWGDMNQNMDCSSTINAVYRCFGILLPRNTSQIMNCGGRVTNLEGMSAAQKEAAITQMSPGTILMMNGHAVIYMGNQNILHNVNTYSPNGAGPEAIKSCIITPLSILNSSNISYLELYRFAITF